ncbi:hypothetical protein C8J56DRAFT_917707 [Mycena floridula]|nr:hypothetical protein C8J56DRAFT_917707 [Mycena floridula]
MLRFKLWWTLAVSGFLSGLFLVFFFIQQASPFDAVPGPFRPTSLLPFSQIFVVSLPSRVDRREQMKTLRKLLALGWNYIDAIPAEQEIVTSILNTVQLRREQAISVLGANQSSPIDLSFHWPEDLDSNVLSNGRLPGEIFSSKNLATPFSPLTCAQNDSTILPFSPEIKPYQILTRARVACWFSHLTAIRQIGESQDYDLGIVLEDDIDMEKDIRGRLSEAWHLLPRDWDMVFLGHCWSNESFHPAILPLYRFRPPAAIGTNIHPSQGPKCTHAYALSKHGARRLYLHLTYPPFAYSRAIDQAFAWLIKTNRLKSFSIVPSVVVQRKIGESDVSSGTGSIWRDQLMDGVFEDIGGG